MQLYFLLLRQNTKSPTLCSFQVLWDAQSDFRGSSHGESRAAQTSLERSLIFFDHRYGTPKGQAEGPEKPAAWHYYFQPWPVQEQQVSKRGVSSSSLSSCTSPKHCHSHRLRGHRGISACFYTLLPLLRVCPIRLYLWDGHFSSAWDLYSFLWATCTPQTCRVTASPPVDYAPLSQLREGALHCSGSHLEKKRRG